MNTRALPRWSLLLLLVVSGYSLVNYLYNAVLNPAVHIGVDFPANYLSAELIQQGKNPYDQRAFNELAQGYGWGPQQVTPFVYHPFFAWLLSPLTLLPPESANALWIVLGQVALWGSVALTGLALARSKGQWFAAGQWQVWAAGSILLAANFRPLFTSFQSGRVDVWILLLIALTFYLLASNRELWAGLPLGLAIMFKITPGLLLLYLAASRRWRAVLSTLLVCGFLTGISIAIHGWDINYTFWVGVLPSLMLGPEWVPDAGLQAFFTQTVPGYESLSTFIGKLQGFKYHNQALSGLFHGLFDSEYTQTIAHSPAMAQLLSVLAMAVVLGLVSWVVLRRFRAGDDLARRARAFDLGFALVLATIPLISSVAWEHHFSTLLFTFSLALAYALRGEKTTGWWVLVALAYAGLAVGYSTYIFDVWRKGVWVFGLYGRAYAALLLVAVAAYLTLVEKGDPALPRLSRWLHRPTGEVRWEWVPVLLLVPLLLVAFSLRLAFAQNSSLYIDEYTSLLAARYTTQLGVPRTPSGAYYTRGVLFNYLEAAILALGPLDKILVRLPSVLLGTGTVLAVFAVGRRMFNATTALLAATWLALAPEAITWSGRARMYALLQLLVLLATYFFYKGVVQERRDGARHLFVLFFLAALFTQLETAMLLPAFGLAWVLWQKPRDWLRPAVWLDLGLLAGGLAFRFYLHGLMVPPGMSTPAVPRSFFTPGKDILAGLQALAPFFGSPDRWLMAGLFLAGIVWLAVLLVRRGWPALRRQEAAAAFVYVFLVAVLVEMAFLVGESWRRPRYLFLILPWFFLAAALVADRGLRALWAWCQRKWPALQANRVSGLGPVLLMTVVAVGVGTVYAPWAIITSRTKDIGYDLAFEFVHQEWQPGDAVATIVPSACLLFLDGCDYFAIERGFEGYSLESNGQKREGWAYIPMLESPEDLEAALGTHPRLWFVIDTMRFDRHFSPQFIAQVWDRMALVASQRGVLVFRSGPEVFVPAVHQPNGVDFNDQLLLTGTDLEAAQLNPGETLRFALNWRALAPLTRDYAVMVHLDDADGQTRVVADGSAVGGLYPMDQWQPGQPIVDRRQVTLPPDILPGRYRLNVALYRPDTGERLPVQAGGDPDLDQATAAFVWVGEPPTVQPPTHPLEATFGRQVCLQGYDLETASGGTTVAPGETVELTLHWEACGPAAENYHTFIHLMAPDGQIAAQADAPPLQGQYPTTYWQTGEELLDQYQIKVPDDAPPGEYPLQVGLYVLDTGERLLLDSGEDRLQLTSLQVRR